MATLDISREPWMVSASCAQVDPEIFFPPSNGSPAPAQAVCTGCPVLAQCREYVDRVEGKIASRLIYGIFAGETAMQRSTRRRAERHMPKRRYTRWSKPQYCVRCGGLMRPCYIKLADAPGTLSYGARGMCSHCAYGTTNRTWIDWSKPQYCAGCHVRMRKKHDRASDYPDTRPYGSRGFCQRCVAQRRGGAK